MTDDEIVIPALLRAARGSYTGAIRASLQAAGFADLPRNGPHVLGAMVNHGATTADITAELDISKQATSQLFDTLVVRGYLRRDTDPADRRRMTIEATERGVDAAAAVRRAVESVDAQLGEMIDADQLAGLRAGLMALADIRERMVDAVRAGARNPFEE